MHCVYALCACRQSSSYSSATAPLPPPPPLALLSQPYFATISNLICAFLFIHKPTRRGSRVTTSSATSSHRLGWQGELWCVSGSLCHTHPIAGSQPAVIPLQRRVTSVVLRHTAAQFDATPCTAAASTPHCRYSVRLQHTLRALGCTHRQPGQTSEERERSSQVAHSTTRALLCKFVRQLGLGTTCAILFDIRGNASI